MEFFKNRIFNADMDIQRAAFIWNMFAGLTSALESVLFSMIVTRWIGLSGAGMVTIGFAAGNLMATIGKYGVRTFQVTDSKEEYAFASYLCARIVTIGLMAAVSVIYILNGYGNNGYSVYKTIVVAMLCLKFVIEALDDVFAGECQRRGRLDAASRIFVIRSVHFMAVFAGVLFWSRHLVFSIGCALTVSIFLEFFLLKTVISVMELTLWKQDFWPVREILAKCFPLCLSAFCFFYLTNAPKYAIDAVMSDEVQACYSFIAFPVFAIELLNNFIYQPSLVRLADDWNQKHYQSVWQRIHRQLLMIFGLTSMAVCGGYLCGIPVLSAVFATDLTDYKKEMLILLCGGGLLAVIGYLSVILVTTRHAVFLISGYAAVSVLSSLLYKDVMISYGVEGGVILYCLLCLALILYEYTVTVVIFRKECR